MLEALRRFDLKQAAVAGILLIGASWGLWKAVSSNVALYTLGGLMGLALAVFALRSKLFWLYTISASTAIFFRTSDVGVSVLDVAVGAYYMGGVGIWFFWHVFVERKKLIYSIADWFFVFFFIAMLGNIVIGYFNGVPLGEALSEYIAFLTFLLYFPAREILQEKRDLSKYLVFLAVVVVYHDLQQFYDYYASVRQGIKYVYQMMSSVRINQSLYTASCLLAIIFSFHVKKKFHKFLLLSFFSLTVVALITSFSRTFWIILIAELFLVALYLPAKKRINLAVFAASAVAILTLTTIIVAPKYARIIGQVLEHRISSSTQGKKDISVTGRIAEYNEVIENIGKLPLGGNGLRKKFSYLDPLSNGTQHKHIIHNGYLFLGYRMGIPIGLVFIFVVVYFTIKSEWMIRHVKDPFYRNVALSAFSMLVLLIISNFTSSQFFYRDGMFVTFFSFAFTEIASRQYAREKQEKALAKDVEN